MLFRSPKMLRVGIISANPKTSPIWVAFIDRIRALGHFEGQNFAVEFIQASGQSEQYVEGMKEFVRRKADILVATGNETALKSAMAATNTLPIVMIAIDYDPFARGYVSSLARPGGNVTGVFFQQIELTMKRLQLMKEAIPGMKVATVLWDRTDRKSTRLNSSHIQKSRMPSSA